MSHSRRHDYTAFFIGGISMGGRGSNSIERLTNGGRKAAKAIATYDRIPLSVSMGGGKYATAEDKKKARDTVKQFLADAQAGNVYSTGAGVGSGSAQFEVVDYNRSPNKLGIRGVNGNRQPVALNSANAKKWISNGATLIKGNKASANATKWKTTSTTIKDRAGRQYKTYTNGGKYHVYKDDGGRYRVYNSQTGRTVNQGHGADLIFNKLKDAKAHVLSLK